jgi:hypothetical protein
MSKRQARRQRGKEGRRRPAASTSGGPAASTAPDASSPEAVAAVTASDKHAQLESQLHRQSLTLNAVFGTTFWAMAAAAAVAGVVCYWYRGIDVFYESLASDVDLVLFIAPRFAAGMVIAAFVAVLLSREKVARYIGESAGVKALGIATVAGGLTPGGPMTAFPIVCSLRDAGTGRSPLVAYITSWSTMGFQRILNWELPLLGPELTLLRLLTSLPLPIIAGITSRMLPQKPEQQAEDAARDAR